MTEFDTRNEWDMRVGGILRLVPHRIVNHEIILLQGSCLATKYRRNGETYISLWEYREATTGPYAEERRIDQCWYVVQKEGESDSDSIARGVSEMRSSRAAWLGLAKGASESQRNAYA